MNQLPAFVEAGDERPMVRFGRIIVGAHGGAPNPCQKRAHSRVPLQFHASESTAPTFKGIPLWRRRTANRAGYTGGPCIPCGGWAPGLIA